MQGPGATFLRGRHGAVARGAGTTPGTKPRILGPYR